MLSGPEHSNISTITKRTLLIWNWAYFCSTRELPFLVWNTNSHHITLVHVGDSWTEIRFDLFCFAHKNVCSHVYVLPNTLAKFRNNLHNIGNRDAGKNQNM
jgi:hypothetical protein